MKVRFIFNDFFVIYLNSYFIDYFIDSRIKNKNKNIIDSIGSKLEANSTKFTEMETKINSIKSDLVLMSNNN